MGELVVALTLNNQRKRTDRGHDYGTFMSIHSHPLIHSSATSCAMLVGPSDLDILRKELKTWERYWRTGATSLQIAMTLLIIPSSQPSCCQESCPHRVPSVELDGGPLR